MSRTHVELECKNKEAIEDIIVRSLEQTNYNLKHKDDCGVTYKEGIGAVVAPKYIRYEFKDDKVILEGYINMYGKESSLSGFTGAIPKKQCKKVFDQVVSAIEQYNHQAVNNNVQTTQPTQEKSTINQPQQQNNNQNRQEENTNTDQLFSTIKDNKQNQTSKSQNKEENNNTQIRQSTQEKSTINQPQQQNIYQNTQINNNIPPNTNIPPNQYKQENSEDNSFFSILFYKRDRKTQEYRISKTKTISILLFIFLFISFMILLLSDPLSNISIEMIFASLIITVILTVPVFVVGYIISYFLDKDSEKSLQNYQQINNQQYNQASYYQQMHNQQVPYQQVPNQQITNTYNNNNNGSSDIHQPIITKSEDLNKNPNDEKIVKKEGIKPLNESNIPLSPSMVCDVCNSSIDKDTAWYVSNDVFYSSNKYRQWFKNQPIFAMAYGNRDVNSVINMMKENDTTEASAVCPNCIHLFADENELKAFEKPKKSIINVEECIRNVANTGEPLTLDGDYEAQNEYDMLVSKGDEVVDTISKYLNNFAKFGNNTPGCETWYYGGKYLVRILGDINTEKSINAVGQLFNLESVFIEWYNYIIAEASIILGNTGDIKWLQTLKSFNHSCAPVNQINEAIEKLSELDNKIRTERKMTKKEYKFSIATLTSTDKFDEAKKLSEEAKKHYPDDSDEFDEAYTVGIKAKDLSFPFDVHCPQCNTLIKELVGYCPNCGHKYVQTPKGDWQFDTPEEYGYKIQYYIRNNQISEANSLMEEAKKHFPENTQDFVDKFTAAALANAMMDRLTNTDKSND